MHIKSCMHACNAKSLAFPNRKKIWKKQSTITFSFCKPDGQTNKLSPILVHQKMPNKILKFIFCRIFPFFLSFSISCILPRIFHCCMCVFECGILHSFYPFGIVSFDMQTLYIIIATHNIHTDCLDKHKTIFSMYWYQHLCYQFENLL